MRGIENYITKITTQLFNKNENGEKIPVGTGFFYKNTSTKNTYLVTNKHIVQKSEQKEEDKNESLYYYVYEKTSYGREAIEQKCVLADFKCHESYDLAVLNISFEQSLDIQYIDDKMIQTQDIIDTYITPIEDIILVGYPDGRYDEVTHLPIVYKGITSTPYNMDYSGRKIFLAQLPGIGGESGSPVFLYYKNIYSDKYDRIYSPSGMLAFLGVINIGWRSNSRKSVIDELESLINKKIKDSQNDSDKKAFLDACKFFFDSHNCKSLLQTSIQICEVIKADVIKELLDTELNDLNDENCFQEELNLDSELDLELDSELELDLELDSELDLDLN